MVADAVYGAIEVKDPLKDEAPARLRVASFAAVALMVGLVRGRAFRQIP